MNAKNEPGYKNEASSFLTNFAHLQPKKIRIAGHLGPLVYL